MKIFILFILILTSCSSHRSKETQPYDKDLVCSLAALEHLKKPSKNASKQSVNVEHIRTEVNKIGPHVKTCYDKELATHNDKFRIMNLCYVVGTDAKGDIEFSNFYSNEEQLSKNFLKCLNDPTKLPNLKQFKSVKISQPIRLHTK